MSNREAAMMKIEQDKNKKNKSGNQRMTYMKQDNWRQEIISLNEGCKTFHFSTPIFTEVMDMDLGSDIFDNSFKRTYKISHPPQL